MWLTGLVAPWHVGSSQTRTRTRVPYIGRQVLNHCATREALSFVFELYFFNKFIYFICLFLAALGLRCCPRALSSCGERGLLFIAVLVLLIAVASLVVELGL